MPRLREPFYFLKSSVSPEVNEDLEGEGEGRYLSNDGLDLLLGLGALTETVLEATVDIGQVTHAAGTGGLSASGLLAPVVYLVMSDRKALVSYTFNLTERGVLENVIAPPHQILLSRRLSRPLKGMELVPLSVASC